MVQLRTIPYTRVVLAKPRLDPSQEQVVHCQGVSFCTEGETCCWLSSNAWACCPTSNVRCTVLCFLERASPPLMYGNLNSN